MAGLFRRLFGKAAAVLLDLLSLVPTLGGSVDPVVGAGRRVVVSGLGVTGPFLVTVMVVGLVLDFVSGAMGPFVTLLELTGLTAGLSDPVVNMLAALLVGVGVVGVGVLVEAGPETGVGPRAETAVESVPGVGTVYSSFDRVSDVLLESDADSFQEVKLVEFPQAETYALAFVTADGPASISTATGEGDMRVLFVPMAPNPVMGGFMVCVPTTRVIDVEMSVEEAFQAIVTSGVAVADPTPA
jgi:uncharacterized membrane protein